VRPDCCDAVGPENRGCYRAHCLATAGSEVRVMQPKEVFNYGTKWAGSTSKPGCGAHTRLGPGDYLVVAKLAGKASSPVVFRLEW
jgi:hypothetical protein